MRKKNNFLEKFHKIIFSFPIPLTIIAGILLFIAPERQFKPIAVFLGILLFAITPFLRRMIRKNYNSPNQNEPSSEFTKIKYKHHEDVQSCIDVLGKINDYIGKNPKNRELKNISLGLKKELNYIKNISEKLDLMIATLNDPYWDLSKIDEKIKEEDSKEVKDINRLNKLNEMKNHIIKLKEKKENLEGHISDTALSFQTIFTKMTLIDNYDRASFDEIETEIKKILDHQIKVNEYEEKLEKELY